VHVFNDFYNCDVSIVEGGRCEFGVESTVLKLLDGEIQVFREGSLSVAKLQAFLREELKGEELPEVSVLRRVEGKQTNMEAPGQLLKHYAPYLPCYFFVGGPANRF
jgi:L-threonylcarbamoyladenylate synthase